MIHLSDVSKSFDGKPIITSISLQVNPGEILCLLGPSGAGKTTLIRLITGALKADSGEIVIGEVKVPSVKLYSVIGFMPQNDALYSDLTGWDNLMFFGGLYNLKGNELKERAAEVLELMDLSEDKDKMVSNYSGGMKKRLSLATTLLHNPKVLLLDEPTVGIDPLLRKSIWDEFQRLKEKGKTIIVTTHVMDEAVKCDRTALIYNGSIIVDDSTQALIDKTEGGNIEELFFMAKEGSVC